jgi:hypothetical protein
MANERTKESLSRKNTAFPRALAKNGNQRPAHARRGKQTLVWNPKMTLPDGRLLEQRPWPILRTPMAGYSNAENHHSTDEDPDI